MRSCRMAIHWRILIAIWDSVIKFVGFQFRPQWRSLFAVTISFIHVLYLSSQSWPICPSCNSSMVLPLWRWMLGSKCRGVRKSCRRTCCRGLSGSEQWQLLSIAPGVFLTSYEMIFKCQRIRSMYFIVPSLQTQLECTNESKIELISVEKTPNAYTEWKRRFFCFCCR